MDAYDIDGNEWNGVIYFHLNHVTHGFGSSTMNNGTTK